MTFQEYFQQVKARFLGADISAVSDPTRIQINLTGQAAGTFYVEIKGGNLAIEPYEYHDRDVEITISSENFQKLIDGKLDPVAAFTFGKLKARGDLGKALELKKLLKQKDSTERRAPVEKKALIAMSGGVDSSVAALLCQQAGFDCMGVTLKLYDNEDAGLPREKTCCSVDDVADARSVAFRLGMPFYVFNFKEAFRREVMDRFVQAYERGETPNPCVDCNRYIKFEKLMRRGEEVGFPYIATGHYARVEFDGDAGRWLLKKGLDENKDQSYMLWSLTQWELSRLLLPLGGLTKERVRQLAEEHGFLNARKRDSQGICFVPDGDYAAFIRRYAGKEFPPGAFVGTQGQVYGQHKGIIHYTVGQRKGLGLSFPQPMFVKELDVEKNRVVLAKAEELFSQEVIARDINLISVESIPAPLRVKARVRYRQKEQPATVLQTGPDELRVVFDQPQRAVTPGQSLVLYDGDTVVGGGKIARK